MRAEISKWDQWKDRRALLDVIGKKLKIKDLSDWYIVKKSRVEDEGGAGMLKYYSSFQHALADVYPDHEWHPWKFRKVQKNIWDERKCVIQFVEALSKKLGIKSLNEWYDVPVQEYMNFGASTLLNKYDGRPGLLRFVYPSHRWSNKSFDDPTRMIETPQLQLYRVLQSLFPDQKMIMKYIAHRRNDEEVVSWIEPKECRNFFEKLEKEWDIKKPTEWSRRTKEEVIRKGGGHILKQFGNSLGIALTMSFPERETVMIGRVQKGYWRDITNATLFVRKMFDLLKLKNVKDWMDIPYEKIQKMGGDNLLHLYGGEFFKPIAVFLGNVVHH